MALWVLLAAFAAGPAAASSLVLRAGAGAVDGWDAATVLYDASGSLTREEVLGGALPFAPAPALRANLGKRKGAVWIRVPVQRAPDDRERWLLDIDYPSLDRVEFSLLVDGRVRQAATLGDHVPMRERPLPSRGHVLALDIPPGAAAVLLLRVQTTGSMVVPLHLRSAENYALAESAEQALQGLIVGMGLCLLLYSLAQWVSLRDALFGLYALTLLGTTAFFAALSGVGPQHVWGASDWLTRNAPPLFILVGVCSAFLFVERALEVRDGHPRTALCMQVCAGVAGVAALLFLGGVIDYGLAQTVGMALGPMPLLLVLPIAYRRLRDGDRAAAYILSGWGMYSLGVLVIVGLLFGALPVNFWTLHGFQFASQVEMSTWMLVLGERVQQIRRRSLALQAERDRLHSLAHTDNLTGLLNRRGLHESLAPLMNHGPRGGQLALFLLDLDGFKAVNDGLGHEAGDQLLVAVGERLRQHLRAGDLVSRLGGDEFVLALGGLPRAEVAEQIGHKLLRAFKEPFDIPAGRCNVGLTIGYAMAPEDGHSLEALLKSADMAMYAGKQAGKHCLRRGRQLPAQPAAMPA